MSLIFSDSHYIGAGSIAGGGVLPSNAQPLTSDDSAKTLAISLLASELDPRLTYTGPAHYYWNEAGQLALSAVNEWPVEYVNGVAVGRHEPEPAAINYQGASQGDDISGADYVSSVNTASTLIEGANGIGAMQQFDANRNKIALYDNAASKWLVNEFVPAEEFLRVRMSGTTSTETAVRTYIARRDSTNYCYALSQQVPAGDVTASFYRWVTSGGVAVGVIQVESGKLTTSPIITAPGKTAVRSASSAIVDVTGYKTLRILFHNGASETYDITGDTFNLSLATEHWGLRYITTIELRR